MRIRTFLLSFFFLSVAVFPALISTSCNVRGFKDRPYPTPWVIAETPKGAQANDVTINYRIIEVDGSTADIDLQFSTDDGATWQPATADGGSGTTGLHGYPFPGASHKIVWDSFGDGIMGTQTCRIRIIGSKSGSGVQGIPGETRDFQVQNPDYPVISWVAKPDGLVRQLPLTFTWKLDTPGIPMANYFYGLDEDPPTGTTTNTSVTIPAPSLGGHTFRVFAQSTAGLNSAVISATFTCDNAAANLPPTVVITNGPSGMTTDNTPTFEYAGSDVDGFVAGYFVSIDVNPPATWTTSTTWTSPELSCGSHTFYVMAQDNEGANSSLVSRPFVVSQSGMDFFPRYIGYQKTGNTAWDVFVKGNYAYVANDDSGLQIVDISDLKSPFLLGSFDTITKTYAVWVEGNYAYLASFYEGFSVVDISNASNPVRVGYFDTEGDSFDVQVVGSLAYLADEWGGFRIFDVSNASDPTLVSTTPFGARTVFVDGTMAYLTDGYNFRLVDVSDPQNPVMRGSSLGGAADACVKGSYAYLTGAAGGIRIYNVSNPDNIALVNTYGDITTGSRMAIYGDLLYVTADAGVYILDITDPVNPAQLAFAEAPSGSMIGLFPTDNYLYTAEASTGIVIYDLFAPSDNIPEFLGSESSPEPARDVAVDGSYAYVACYSGEVLIVDCSVPENATMIATYPMDPTSHADKIVANNSIVYVADRYHGIQIVDVSDPYSPQNASFFPMSGYPEDVYLHGSKLFFVDRDDLFILDVSDPYNPSLDNKFNLYSGAWGVCANGSHAFCINSNGWLEIVDVTNTTAPVSTCTQNIGGMTRDIVVQGIYAYVKASGDGIRIVDVSDVYNPNVITSFPTPRSCYNLFVRGNYVFIADEHSGLIVADVSDPAKPILATYYNTPGPAISVDVVGNRAFIADDGNGLQILKIYQ